MLKQHMQETEYVSSAVRPCQLSRLHMAQAEETTTWMLSYKCVANASVFFLVKDISPIAFQRAYLTYESTCGCLFTSPTGHKLAYGGTSKMH